MGKVEVNLHMVLAKQRVRANELAEKIGITPQNVSLLRTGKVKGIRFDTMAAICKALNCQPGDILSYTEE